MTKAAGVFKVASFHPAEVPPAAIVETGTPVGVSTMEKHYEGEVAGLSATLFTAAYDQATGTGTYVAMESFAGTVNGLPGTFNFTHAASTTGADRTAEYFAIVPGSGTGDLSGIAGTGGLTIDEDGTHRIWLDYTLP